MKNEEFYEIIKQKESENLEFKVNIPKEKYLLAREISAMANNGGGLVIIGVKEGGEIVGIPKYMYDDFLIEKISVFLEPKLNIKKEVFEIENKIILILEIKESNKLVYFFDGKAYNRVQDKTIALKPSEIYNFILKKTRTDQPIQTINNLFDQVKVLADQIEKLDKIVYKGTLENLEESIVYSIYDFLLKNPTLFHKPHRGISEPRKKYIKKRDHYTCQFCGDIFPEDKLIVDHIFPYSLGGSNEEVNLMALCEDCNNDNSYH